MASRRGSSQRTSQADVARHARVSPGLVSSVINGRDHGSIRISEATRERVWRSVRELGYVPNLAARTLARGRNRLIAVFTYLPAFPYESRNFYHEFLIGIEEMAEETGYNLLMMTGTRGQGRRSVYAGGVNNLQLADAAVLLGPDDDPGELHRLSTESYPFAFIGRRPTDRTPLSYVAADYRGGTAAIVRELHRLGHRRIALVQGPGHGEPVPGRRPGFLAGCRAVGLAAPARPRLGLATPPNEHERGVAAVADVEDLVRRLRATEMTAAIVEETGAAQQLVDTARAMGVSVPGQLSVLTLSVGSDLSADAAIGRLVIPRREMGRESVAIVLRLLDREEPGEPIRTTIACGFDPGGTVNRPGAAR